VLLVLENRLCQDKEKSFVKKRKNPKKVLNLSRRLAKITFFSNTVEEREEI
jgi:hypothetical protein